jgi:hypothetical protein
MALMENRLFGVYPRAFAWGHFRLAADAFFGRFWTWAFWTFRGQGCLEWTPQLRQTRRRFIGDTL